MTADAAAARYGGEAGAAYFAWQRTAGLKGALYNRKFFEPYIRETDSVLDFGCGGGYMLQALSCRTRVGVDVNPAARAEACRFGIEALADLKELGDRTFDVVISSHCLEHVANPYETLVLFRKALQEGGRMILLLPVDDWRDEPWRRPDINGHLYTWTPRLLGNLLVSAGLEPSFIRIVNRMWPPRFGQQIWAISSTLFEALGCACSILLRRRQIWALARKQDPIVNALD